MGQVSPAKPVGLRPGTLDLVVVRGDDFRIRLEFFDANDDPLDVSDWDLQAQMRSAYQGPLIATFTLDQTGLPDNELNLLLDDSDTVALGEGVFPWDAVRVSGGQVIRTLLSGVAVVKPRATVATQ